MEELKIGGQVVILLMGFFLLYRGIRKLPPKLATAMISFVVIMTVVIILTGIYYPEQLVQFNDYVKGKIE